MKILIPLAGIITSTAGERLAAQSVDSHGLRRAEPINGRAERFAYEPQRDHRASRDDAGRHIKGYMPLVDPSILAIGRQLDLNVALVCEDRSRRRDPIDRCSHFLEDAAERNHHAAAHKSGFHLSETDFVSVYVDRYLCAAECCDKSDKRED